MSASAYKPMHVLAIGLLTIVSLTLPHAGHAKEDSTGSLPDYVIERFGTPPAVPTRMDNQ